MQFVLVVSYDNTLPSVYGPFPSAQKADDYTSYVMHGEDHHFTGYDVVQLKPAKY
jgi:hypothetical protein